MTNDQIHAPDETLERPTTTGSPIETNDGAVSYSSMRTQSSIPDVLNRERFEEHLRKFATEYKPVGPTECALVRVLARQATAMDRCEEAVEAVERNAARNLPEVATSFPENEFDFMDAVLSGAMATAVAQKLEQLGLTRTRAFLRILHNLEVIQARRKDRENSGATVMPPPFPTESACEAYLIRRLQNGLRQCSACGNATGCFLPSRRVWECRKCGKQFGVRSGTVMADSALPLHVWCEAIRLLLWRPTIGTADLATRIGIRRLTTVRTMAQRILAAMGANDASAQLAGLDLYFARAVDNLK